MTRFEQRRQRLRKQLKLAKQSSFLVTSLVNVGYLTGFSGSAGWLLVGADQDRMISDSRYATQLSEECPGLECEIRTAKETQLQTLARVVKSSRFHALQYEADSLSKASYDQLATSAEGVELVSTSKVVENLRAVKDATEIEVIRKSIKINQRVFEVIRNQLRPEQTELEVAYSLENQMRLFGASGVAFAPAVAAGARSALPHAKPTDQPVGSSPFLLIDWGTKYQGYASDLTRIIATAKVPAKFRKIYDVVLAAQTAAIAAIKPGATFQEIDSAARTVIENAGYGKYFGHGLGHGFGLEIHENPFLSPISQGELVAGMVVTVEPGIYLPSFGGVRIEDDVLVTQNGCELLSDLPKELDACLAPFV